MRYGLQDGALNPKVKKGIYVNNSLIGNDMQKAGYATAMLGKVGARRAGPANPPSRSCSPVATPPPARPWQLTCVPPPAAAVARRLRGGGAATVEPWL